MRAPIRAAAKTSSAVSYTHLVGSDGAFTGAATCMGYALFFKENTLHKLYGSKPSDFQLSSLRCRGVAKGAARSLCVINEMLYYLSPDGVMAWDGNIPTKVSTEMCIRDRRLAANRKEHNYDKCGRTFKRTKRYVSDDSELERHKMCIRDRTQTDRYGRIIPKAAHGTVRFDAPTNLEIGRAHV